MKNKLTKKIVLVVLILVIISLAVNVVGFFYVNRGMLFDSFAKNGGKIFQLKIGTTFDLEEVKEVVQKTTQQKLSKINVEKDELSSDEVYIRIESGTNYENQDLIDSLKAKYGNAVEPIDITAIGVTNRSGFGIAIIFLLVGIQIALIIGLSILYGVILRNERKLIEKS